MNYWLFKSEPDEYSIDTLANEKNGFGRWDGIRNYQARNLIRDKIAEDDMVFFYHSSCKVPGVAGIAKVVKPAYPDPAQFNPDSKYYDPKSSQDNVRWFCVDLAFVEKFKSVVSLQTLKSIPSLDHMVLLKQGRLSVQPVTKEEWQTIISAAK
ncbi:EVE domain-containing protein [Sessilibacter sp. MAH4]